MYNYSFKGKSYEISKENILYIIAETSKGYLFWAEEYHRGHLTGFPDISGNLVLPDKGQYQFMREIEKGIQDDELFEVFTEIKEELKEMIDIDNQIVKWLTNYIGLPPTLNKKDREKVKNKIHKLVLQGSPTHIKGPFWVSEIEYKELVMKSENALSSIKKSNQRIQRRIIELLNEMRKKET